MRGKTQAKDGAPIIIKKYANRRLYNTRTSSYITLDNVKEIVSNGDEFVVKDAKTNEDLTRSVLTQIIMEEEARGENMLPVSFLRRLISFYGGNLQWMVPQYLDQAMSALSSNQERLQGYFQQAVENMLPPFQAMEEIGKKNLSLFEQAMTMFTPFPADDKGDNSASPLAGPSLEELEEQAARLQKEIARRKAQK